jgi:hypothetical protein
MGRRFTSIHHTTRELTVGKFRFTVPWLFTAVMTFRLSARLDIRIKFDEATSRKNQEALMGCKISFEGKWEAWPTNSFEVGQLRIVRFLQKKEQKI